MGTHANPQDDDMPAEIDFSAGIRGKFHRPGMALSLPVCLDAEVQSWLLAHAGARGIEVDQLINELLRASIASIEAGPK